MGNDLEQTVNLAAYERLKSELAAKYPKGHFIGIANGKVVADAATLDELIVRLRALGLDPKRVLGVQAGIEVPQYAIIFGPLGVARE
jgi:cobalamin biosynthesis protein CbiG